MQPFIASNEMQVFIGLEIVSIRFSIRPPIAIRSGSKSKKVRSRSKIYDRDRTFLDFDRRSKLRSGLSIFLFNVRLLKLCKTWWKWCLNAPFKSMPLMLSHSKLTSSRILPTLFYLKKKLQCDETDSGKLIKILTFLKKNLEKEF